MAALEYLSDNYPITTTEFSRLIVKDTFVIIIYNSLSVQSFAGQAVFAAIGANFTANAFQVSHIWLDVFDGIPTASIGLPNSLLNGHLGEHRTVFNFFLNNGLFVQRANYVAQNNLQHTKIGGLTLGAHIAGLKVTNLSDPVSMTFTINPVRK